MAFKLISRHRVFRSFPRPALKMQLFYLLLFSLVALASANTLPNSYSTKAGTYCIGDITTANYDDLPRQPPASVPNPIAPYRALKYSNFVLLTVGDSPAGIMPASSPNVIGFGVVTAGSTSSVTIIGGGISSKFFKGTSIAYACAVGAVETVVSVPISCTLALSGYKAGVLVKRIILNYVVANGEVNKTMSVANLYGIPIMDTLTFELVPPIQPAVAARFDNFKYIPECF